MKKHIVIAAIFVLGCIGAVLVHRSFEQKDEIEVGAQAGPETSRLRGHWRRKKLTLNGQPLWNDQEIGTISRGVLDPEKPVDDSTLNRIMKASLDVSEGLKAFSGLRAKSLRSSVENKAYFELLSNEELIDEVVHELLNADGTQENEIRRVVGVQYLASALAWEKNPARENVISATDQVLLTVPSADTPMSSRQSLYGDKMELFQYLLGALPDEAERVKQAAQGTPMERILGIAEGMVTPSAAN